MVVAMFALSACGIPSEGVDVAETAPDGPWQTFVVWPLANSLIWLNNLFAESGIPYDWGFAIIAFTLIIRIIMFPLTLVQIRGMEAQKAIQPKMQEIQKKHGKDREKLAQEQMALYKEAGVNPLSGCLPLIVQMPILFGLYSALIALGQRLEGSPFFWIPDVGFPSYTGGLGWIANDYNCLMGNLALESCHGNQFDYGPVAHLAAYLVLPIMLVASQYAMQKWMTPTAPGGDNSQANMTKQVGTMMTFMFGFFTLQVPAGLSLYWVTSNLLQMLQQWFIAGNMKKNNSLAAVGAGATGSSVVLDGEINTTANGTGDAKKPVTKKADNRSKKKRRSRRK